MKFFLIIGLAALPLWGQIQGRVVISGTDTGLEGAIVRIQKREAYTTTDAAGNFTLLDTATPPFKVTAALFGYFNGFSEVTSANTGDSLVISMDAVLLETIPDHPLNPPGECAGCHPQQHFEWSDSPMRKTGLNTWVFDVWDGQGTAGGMNGFVYKRDSIHRFASPNSDCSACHSPVHWLTDIDTAGMGDISNPNADMQDGVQCEVCHRAYDVPADKLNFPGVDPEAFVFLRGPQHVEFGLLGDATYTHEIMRPAYNPLMQAQLCASCHEDNVDVDDDGDFEDEGSVEHETTFSEWELYRNVVGAENAQTCIDCHMPFTDETQFCIWEQEPRRPGTIRSHNIRGTTPEFLENAVTLNAEQSQEFDTLTVTVSVANFETGHSVPTGVMLRNMLLLVQARNESGQLLTQSGGGQIDEVGGIGNPDDGYFAGLPGHAFYLNMITAGGQERVFYTEAETIVDTRLKPGQVFQDDFVFDLGADPGENVDIDVRLIYRRAYREVADIKGWTLTGLGQILEDLQPPHFGHLMERAEFSADVCANKDVDGSQSINIDDVHALSPLWGQAAPFSVEIDPVTNIRHFVTLVNCL